jgi:plasmid stabilization system protein ParE
MAEILLAENFLRQLDNIIKFLGKVGASGYAQKLIDRLEKIAFANLRKFPLLGRDARELASKPRVKKAFSALAKVHSDASLRQYIFGEYILLYLASKQKVILLAIRHHRQSDFEIRTRWI